MRIRMVILVAPGRKIKEDHQLPDGGDMEEFGKDMVKDHNAVLGPGEFRRELLNVTLITECLFCKKVLRADDICNGCKEFICSECETESPLGRNHDPEDHNPGAEVNEDDDEETEDEGD